MTTLPDSTGMAQLHSFFADRVGILATMHRKERVIAPLLERELGIRIVVPTEFDTDIFGTFTRDRSRPGTQLDAARLKAKKALEITGATLAIASEGTFSPHPSFPAIPCNRELVLLLDQEQELEIVGQAVSLQTNYSHKLVKSVPEALEFAQSAGFPAHGLVVMPQPSAQPNDIRKGIVSESELIDAVTVALQRSSTGTIHLETDMRALYNPTRMGVIEQATLNLVQTLQRQCPACSTPGLALVERRPGLLCSLCHSPTQLTRSAIYRCQKCEFQQEVLFPDRQQLADPTYCSYCNP